MSSLRVAGCNPCGFVGNRLARAGTTVPATPLSICFTGDAGVTILALTSGLLLIAVAPWRSMGLVSLMRRAI